jgi:hypothetical protein
VRFCPALEVLDMSDRVLWFPDDIAIGFVEATIGEAVVLAAPARGRLNVPAGAHVHLWLRCPVRGLGQIHADDVTSIRLEKKTATDDDFARLSPLTGLRELNASKSHAVGDAGLAAVAGLRRLRELDLYASCVTDAGLAHVAGMPELEFLHLSDTGVAGPGLVNLVGLQRLRYLKLDETGVGDECIPYLLRLTALERLTLTGTRITTRGLARLRAGLPRLRDLHMSEPGRRVALERARAAVLGILARRIRPRRGSEVATEAELRALLPRGSRIVEIRYEGRGPRTMGWELDDLDATTILLRRLGNGFDLHIVTPDGLDEWIPWLRPRGRGDRRRTAARRPSDPFQNG